MEALSFLKFWRPTSPISSPKLHLDEEDDSFFELKLPNLNDAEILNSDAASKNRAFPIPLFSPRNLFSGRKVQPFEAHRRHSRRPNQRISLFKPSPHFRTFWSRTFSSPETEQAERKTEHSRRTSLSAANPGGEDKNAVSASKRFSKIVKPSPHYRTFWGRTVSSPETEQGELKTEHRRRTNLSAANSGGAEKNAVSASKRFSKIVKPFSGEEVRSFRVKASPLSSPMAAAWKLAGKGKSSSGTAAKSGVVSPARGNDSVSVQQEGIQSAILHCKKSLHSV